MSQKSELYDLHCHSTCSDGTKPPGELLHLAKKAGLTGLSITDHDTLDAYTPEFFKEAEELGIRILVGIECSSEYKGESVHILGYRLDLQSPATQDLLTALSNARNKRNQLLVDRLKRAGIDCSSLFTEEKLIGRPHIAKWLIQQGYTSSIREGFDRYLKEELGSFLTSIQVIEAIRLAGGKAILAHPHIVKHAGSLLQLPFDGLECHYGRATHKQNKPWIKVARAKGWIITGGSDYHGSNTPHLSLGCTWVDSESCSALFGINPD